MSQKYYSYVDHPTARWYFVCSELGLELVTIEPIKGALAPSKQPLIARQHAQALCAMLDGEMVHYSLPLNISGSHFQQLVWDQIARIPHATTIDYSELAKRAGNPSAVRAAASACGKNPVPVAVPCHRVLRADGTLGGFAFGVELKARMLVYESECRKKAAA